MALGKAVIASSCRSRVMVVVALLLTACAGSGDASLGGEPTQAATPEPTPSSQEFVRYEDPFGVFAFEYPANRRKTRSNDQRTSSVDFATYDAAGQGHAFSVDDVSLWMSMLEPPEAFGNRDGWRRATIAGQEAEVTERTGEDLLEGPGVVALIQAATIRLPKPVDWEGRTDFEFLGVTMWTGRDTPEARETFVRILDSVRFL
ncbi:MAG: hypothetical protein ACLGH3_03375 [Actinomycetota bacterium]